MKIALASMLALTLGAGLLGCDKGEEGSTTTTANANTTNSTDQTPASDLGMTKTGEHFDIKLTTEPAEPKAGEIKFTAAITHHGSAAEGAKVRLQPEMPGQEVDVAEIEMKEVGPGKYEGTADIKLAGKWQAKVFVDQEGHTGDAAFSFEIKE